MPSGIPTADHLVVFGIVALLSIVQSIFGIGLLVFGTPALLLMGYPFDVALCCLLPSSIAISMFQVIQGWHEIAVFRGYVPMFILPFVLIGYGTIFYVGAINLNIIIGLALVLTALLRLFIKINTNLATLLKRNLVGGLMLTGLIHGATNLGGAPLAIIVNGCYADKNAIRANIAYAYLLMAISQIAILIIMQRSTFDAAICLLPAIAVATYFILGQRVFKKAGGVAYHHLMTIVIFFFGVCLLSRR